MNKKLKEEATNLAVACYFDGQVFQTGRTDLTPKRRSYHEKKIVKLINKATLAQKEKDAEIAREIADYETGKDISKAIINQQDDE